MRRLAVTSIIIQKIGYNNPKKRKIYPRIGRSTVLVYNFVCGILIDLDTAFKRVMFIMMRLSSTRLYVLLMKYREKLFSLLNLGIVREDVGGRTILIDEGINLLTPKYLCCYAINSPKEGFIY